MTKTPEDFAAPTHNMPGTRKAAVALMRSFDSRCDDWAGALNDAAAGLRRSHMGAKSRAAFSQSPP